MGISKLEILFIFVISLMLRAGEATNRCFVCQFSNNPYQSSFSADRFRQIFPNRDINQSPSTPACGDYSMLTERDSNLMIQCNGPCLKMKVEQYGYQVIIRDCGGFSYSNRDSQKDKCEEQRQGDTYTYSCQCFSELCNSGPSLLYGWMTMVAAIVLAVLAFQRW